MKKAIVLALAVLALSMLVSGCAKQPLPGPADSAVQTDIDADISGIADIDSDLDLSELDALDAELADIESLFS